MKKFIITLLSFTCVITSLVFTACRKDGYHPDRRSECRIQQLKGDFVNSNDSAVFAYNTKGDPVSITRTHTATGYPNYLFRYDVHQRLTEYIGIYSDGLHFEFRYRYGYDRNNLIVTDTLYTFGALTDPLATLHKEGINNYTYDQRKRIIRVDGVHVPTGTKLVSQYFYNQEGNLERVEAPGGGNLIKYDNKVNIHRTHPIWQFIDRDFSMNNPFQAVAYNSHGLPVAIQSPPCTFGINFIDINFMYAEVTYKCHGAAPAGTGHIVWPDNTCPQ